MKKPKWDLSIFTRTEIFNRLIEAKENSVELIDIPGYNSMVATFNYQPGQVGKEHRHGQTRIVFIRSGKVRFTVDSKTFEVAAGDFFFMLPNTPHSFEVVGQESPHLVEVLLFKSKEEQENWIQYGENKPTGK